MPATPAPTARRLAAGLVVGALALLAPAAAVAQSLAYAAVDETGSTLAERDAERPINPASVVKVATSLWALEELGPDHRFATRFAALGSVDGDPGTLAGDLLVLGGGDPDFHLENAFLVARELAAGGVRRVTGRLRVEPDFWIGWEGGSARRLDDATARAELMAGRLREAWDPDLWSPATRRAWEELAERRGLSGDPPAVRIAGGVGPWHDGDELPDDAIGLAVHRSNPLIEILRRFGTYSNNDIERFATTLGGPDALAEWLTERWGVEPGAVRLETLSGLGVNRMSPRLVLRLLADFEAVLARHGRTPRDALPVSGCGPSTLESYPLIDGGPGARAVVAKTGTLTTTDGGVAVLAGWVQAAEGPVRFAAAAPGSGARLAAARGALDRWVRDLAAARGGFRAGGCGDALLHSDTRAEVVPWAAAEPAQATAAGPTERPRPGGQPATEASWPPLTVLIAVVLLAAVLVVGVVLWLRRG